MVLLYLPPDRNSDEKTILFLILLLVLCEVFSSALGTGFLLLQAPVFPVLGTWKDWDSVAMLARQGGASRLLLQSQASTVALCVAVVGGRAPTRLHSSLAFELNGGTVPLGGFVFSSSTLSEAVM
jgi:hypothetical protein